MMASRGRFITFEGGEGAGKSTQIGMLARRLSTAGRELVITREPGGSALAERIRGVLLDGSGAVARSALAETLLFNAARADHLEQLIRPALARGALVLCDRFADSTRAYQGAASGVAPATIDTLERIVVADSEPDLTVILDLDPAVGLARARARAIERGEQAPDRFEAADLDFHRRLRDAFLAIARAEPRRCIVVDATAAEDEVAGVIWRLVEARLPAW